MVKHNVATRDSAVSLTDTIRVLKALPELEQWDAIQFWNENIVKFNYKPFVADEVMSYQWRNEFDEPKHFYSLADADCPIELGLLAFMLYDEMRQHGEIRGYKDLTQTLNHELHWLL